jgi:hypothetical protein
MLEALYGIEFQSKQNNNGGYGVAVLETGRILGGDSSFVFVGTYAQNNGTLEVEVKCTNDRNILQSIFGDIGEFTLKVKGQPDPEHKEFILQGHMVENPDMEIGIKLTRRAELP